MRYFWVFFEIYVIIYMDTNTWSVFNKVETLENAHANARDGRRREESDCLGG